MTAQRPLAAGAGKGRACRAYRKGFAPGATGRPCARPRFPAAAASTARSSPLLRKGRVRGSRWAAVPLLLGYLLASLTVAGETDKHFLPYDEPRHAREEVFAFAKPPVVRNLGNDRYEIRFETQGLCDVTLAVVDPEGRTVRRLASGVLGANAPAPFKKNSREQVLYWDGKDDLGDYLKDPLRMRVRVCLGLKPAFERILGWHPYDAATWDVMNVYRAYRSLDIDERGVYILSSRHPQLRQYDHDGNYLRTVYPPPANLPVEGLRGLTSLEAEAGRRVPHGPSSPSASPSSLSGGGAYLDPVVDLSQHARLVGGQLVFMTASYGGNVHLHRLDTEGCRYADPGREWEVPTRNAMHGLKGESYIGETKLAASPDGRYLYVSGLYSAWYGATSFAVHRLDTTREDARSIFIGEMKKPGSDNQHFMRPEGLDVDAQGRLYVCDLTANALKVFSPEGLHLKTIPVKQPYLVRVDRKRGGIYLLHAVKPDREFQWELVRLESFERPEARAAVNLGALGGESIFSKKNNELLMAVDAWSEHPRIWVTPNSFNVRVYEDRGATLASVLDFQEATRKAGLEPHMMNAAAWQNVLGSKLTADATQESLYLYGMSTEALRYDLRTGKHRAFRKPIADFYFDMGCDGRGYLFTHVNGAVARQDPRREFAEVPFDYGIAGEDCVWPKYVLGCKGVLPLKDQEGGKGYQDGLGVNVRGDVVAASAIYYIPKFEASEIAEWAVGGGGGSNEGYCNQVAHRKTAHADWQRGIENQLKRGEAVYSVRPTAGRLLGGDTLWVFDANGELRSEDILTGLGLVAGVQIDHSGNLYTVFNRTKLVAGRPFLAGRASVIGPPDRPAADPSTGTLIKAPPSGAKVLLREAQIAMEHWPDRPLEVKGGWVEGAEWLYGGVGPVGNGPLASSRLCTDWYARTFVPENYRHSVGVLDSNGNLVLHIGRYGNADSGRGAESKVKTGGDEIAFAQVLGLTSTDRYLCVADMGNERVVVLRLEYQVQEELPISKP